MALRLVPTLVFLIILVGCDHASPFAINDPEPLGPFSDTPPIRLTFNPGDDRHPTASAELVVYSRLEAGRSDFDRCLALLPVGVGTLSEVACVGSSSSDSLVDVMIEPALSADGQIAYVREQGRLLRLGAQTRTLVIAGVHAPTIPTAEFTIPFWLSDGRRVSAVQQLSWSRPGVLRFLLGDESIVVGRGTVDTVFTAYGIAELAVQSGALLEIVGADSAITYAAAPDSGIWFVRSGSPAVLLHLATDGLQARVAGEFSTAVSILAAVDGEPLGVLLSPFPSVERLDTTTGVPADTIPAPGPVGRIHSIPGTRQFVAEVIVGNAADLWLLELP